MSKMKKQYSPQFKAKVALEAVEGVKSIAELSGEYKIYPSKLFVPPINRGNANGKFQSKIERS
jgi:transposase-like protein